MRVYFESNGYCNEKRAKVNELYFTVIVIVLTAILLKGYSLALLALRL